MAITGIHSAGSNVYESLYVSSKKEAAQKDGTLEAKDAQKFSNVSEYYEYLKDKYSCLRDSDYKVTISPAFLEKCIKDPEKADLMERSLAHLPVDHQNMTAFWSAQGAEVVNEQWIFDENGNCGGSTSMSVVSKGSSAGNSIKNSAAHEKTQRKSTAQKLYDERVQERKQFEKRQEEKRRIKEQTEEKWFREQQLKEQTEKNLEKHKKEMEHLEKKQKDINRLHFEQNVSLPCAYDLMGYEIADVKSTMNQRI